MIQIGVRDTRAQTNVRVCCEMENAVDVHLHGTLHVTRLAKVAFDNRDLSACFMVGKKGFVPAGKVVQHDHFISPANQSVNEVGANESGTTCYQGSHG